MYSNHPDFNIENQDHTMFINNNPRSRNSLGQQQQQPSPSYHAMHQNNNNNSNGFAPMAINPSNTVQSGQNGIPFADPSTNWFGTSMDSNASSFGQSPVFGGRDLLVTPSNSTGHIIDGYTGAEDDELGQRNHQEMFEKRRRRRESHNAVERRRRDNINERIQELSTLLPDHLLESVPASSNVMSVTTGQNGTNGKPINKGTILKLSVDHIKELREEVTSCKSRIKELEHLIEIAKRGEQPDLRHLKTEDANNGLNLYNQQQQQVMQNMMNNNAARSVRHERVGSIQFQRQFGKLHINGEEQKQQA